MHRYRIVARISCILSILNLVLAAPIVVQGIHEARGDEMVVAEDVAAMPKKWRALDAASDRLTSPPSPDTMASPQHSSSSDGSTSSGYPAPHLSSDSSVSGYSWLLDRPPRLSLSPHLPASLYDSASPDPSSSGSSEIPHPAVLQGLAPEIPPDAHTPLWWYLHILAPEVIPPLPLWLQFLAPLPHPSSSGSSEIPPSPQLTGSDRAMTETYSPSGQFTPSHIPSSLSSTDPFSNTDESMSTPYSPASGGSPSLHRFPASDGSVPSPHSMPEGLAPSHHLTSDGSPPSSPTDSFSWYRNPLFSDESMSTPYLSASGGTLSSHYLSASDGRVPSHDSISMPSLESISGGSMPSHHSMPEGLTPSHHLTSDGSMHSLESISGWSVPSQNSMPEGLTPSHHLTSDGSPPSPSSPPTETPPDNAEFFNKNMMKKLKIVVGVAIVGSVIAGIVGSQVKQRDFQDS